MQQTPQQRLISPDAIAGARRIQQQAAHIAKSQGKGNSVNYNEEKKLDMNTLKTYFAGPGDYDLMRGLPPGTDCFQCELAPSGHLVIPCCEFGPKEPTGGNALTLITRPPGLEVGGGHKRSRVVPPPPNTAPPDMPAAFSPAGPPEGAPRQTNQ